MTLSQLTHHYLADQYIFWLGIVIAEWKFIGRGKQWWHALATSYAMCEIWFWNASMSDPNSVDAWGNLIFAVTDNIGPIWLNILISCGFESHQGQWWCQKEHSTTISPVLQWQKQSRSEKTHSGLLTGYGDFKQTWVTFRHALGAVRAIWLVVGWRRL